MRGEEGSFDFPVHQTTTDSPQPSFNDIQHTTCNICMHTLCSKVAKPIASRQRPVAIPRSKGPDLLLHRGASPHGQVSSLICLLLNLQQEGVIDNFQPHMQNTAATQTSTCSMNPRIICNATSVANLTSSQDQYPMPRIFRSEFCQL